jgi:hypothetical protein
LTDTFEELFAEAEQDLKKQEIPDEWGPLRTTEEGERILARFIGRDEMPPFNDVVFRFVEYPGERRFSRLTRGRSMRSGISG